MESSSLIVTEDNSRAVRSAKTAKTAGYFGAFIGLGMAGAMLGPTLPSLAEHTGSSLSQISYVFTARALGYLLGSVIGGRTYDRMLGHPLMGLGLLALAGAIAAIPVIPLLWALVLLMLLLGAMEGTVDVGGNTMLVWVHHPKTGPYMNALHFFFGVGTFIAPILIAQLMQLTGGINWPFWAMALLIAPVSLWILRQPSPASLRESSGQADVKANPLLVGLIALLFFMVVGAEVSFGGWVYTYAVTLKLAGATQAAYLTSLYWGSFTLGRLLGIPITMRVRPRWVLMGDVLGCLLGLLVIVFYPAREVGIWVGTFLFGISMASVFPTLISFAEHRMTLTGKVTSYFFVGSSLSGMVIPWLIGQLFVPVGPGVAMVIILIDMVVAFGVYSTLILYSNRLTARPAQ